MGRRKSKDEKVNKELKEIQRLLTEKAFNIKGRRVTSKGNIADALSRVFLGELQWFDEVKVELPSDLTTLLNEVFPCKTQPLTNT